VTSPESLSVKYLHNRSGCEIRTTVFNWTPTRFPFHTGTAKTLKFGKSPVFTVIGKAMWDVGHAPKEQNNRRKYAGLPCVGNSSGGETGRSVIFRQHQGALPARPLLSAPQGINGRNKCADQRADNEEHNYSPKDR
jgi:hypothetical protein